MNLERKTYKDWKRQKRRYKLACFFCDSNDVNFKKRYFLSEKVVPGFFMTPYYNFCNESCANLYILERINPSYG